MSLDPELARFRTNVECYTDPVGSFVTAYIVLFIGFFTNIALCISSLSEVYCKYVGHQRLDTFIRNRKHQILYYIIFLSYLFSDFIVLMAMSCSMVCCFDEKTGKEHFFYSWVISGRLKKYSLAAIYLFFVLRLYRIDMKLNKYVISVLVLGFIAQIACNSVAMFLFITSPAPYTQAQEWSFIGLITNITANIMVLVLFITKIRGLIKPHQENEDERRHLLSLSYRYFLLYVVAMFSTVIVSLMSLLRSQGKNTMTLQMIQWIIIGVDECINLFCLYLQFPFANKAYQILCFVFVNIIYRYDEDKYESHVSEIELQQKEIEIIPSKMKIDSSTNTTGTSTKTLTETCTDEPNYTNQSTNHVPQFNIEITAFNPHPSQSYVVMANADC